VVSITCPHLLPYDQWSAIKVKHQEAQLACMTNTLKQYQKFQTVVVVRFEASTLPTSVSVR